MLQLLCPRNLENKLCTRYSVVFVITTLQQCTWVLTVLAQVLEFSPVYVSVVVEL